MHSIVITKKVFKIEDLYKRGDEWARTTDTRIFSPMLYQLSYITVLGLQR